MPEAYPGTEDAPCLLLCHHVLGEELWSAVFFQAGRKKRGDIHISEQANRKTLERLVQAFQQRDVDALAELVHDDIVEEYPQSGERVRGKQNYLRLFENFPLMPNVLEYRFTLSGTSPSPKGP